MTESLDLTRHSVDELSGKALDLNGARYILGDKIAEGGHKIILPMLNVRTGLQQLAAKVFKDTPDSNVIERAVKVRQALFAREVVGDPVMDHFSPPEELYPFPGCVVAVEPLFFRWNDAARDIERARALLEAGELSAALDEYRRVVNAAPNHSLALSDMGACLISMNEPAAAIAYIQEAIALEPNIHSDYGNLATAQLSLDAVDEAFETIEAGLRRYRLSPDLWKQKITFATRLGRTPVLEDMRAEIEAQPIFERLEAHLRDKIAQSARNHQVRQRAAQLRDSSDWSGCSDAWDEYFQDPNGLVSDRLDDCNCKYNAGKFAEAAHHSFAALQFIPTQFAPTFVVINLVSSARAGNTRAATEMAELLSRLCTSPVDLPGWATRLVWYEDDDGVRYPAMLESLEFSPIVAALEGVRDMSGQEPDARACAEQLLVEYRARGHRE